ncbi:hypothetical protein L6R52_03930 [Myxococcota bacterium]|nr:hypothetical protein [Myxococcota bacterium]
MQRRRCTPTPTRSAAALRIIEERNFVIALETGPARPTYLGGGRAREVLQIEAKPRAFEEVMFDSWPC